MTVNRKPAARPAFSPFQLRFALFLLLYPAAAQQVLYERVKPSILEERLHLVKAKTAEREQALQELFTSAGCTALEELPVKHAHTPNVLCTMPGTSEQRIIVGAHYDKVPASQGVIDNWTGAALLPSLFQGLHGRPRRLTFLFIGFTDEEEGLVGSRFYTAHMSREDRARTLAMVNIDSLGLTDTKIWLSRADKKLANAAAAVAHALQLPLAAVDVERIGESDSRPFFNAGIPVIDFHSLTQETFRILHSPRDAFSALNMTAYTDSCNLLVAYLAYLDATLGVPTAAAPPASP